MKCVLVVVSVVVAVARSQVPYGSYGGGGGGFHGRPGNFPGRPGIFPGRHGGGGQIQFPGSHGKPGKIGGLGGAGAGGVGGLGGTGSGGQAQEQPLSTQFCPKFVAPKVHVSVGGNNYHFSWCADGGQKYVWQQANSYCKQLGPGWGAVSIETGTENQFISTIIDKHGLPYIWTSGNRLSGGFKDWRWGTGQPLKYTNWALTGLMISLLLMLWSSCGVLGDHFLSPDGFLVLFPSNQTTENFSPLLLPAISQGSQTPAPSSQLGRPQSLLPILTTPSSSLPVSGPILPLSLPRPVQTPLCIPMTGGLIHHARRNSAYHLSWCSDPRMLKWDDAVSYCKNLRRDFQPLSIEDKDEDDFIVELIAKHPIQFIWTSGNKLNSGSWRWLSASAFVYTNWSPTGGRGQPQPDNREGNEDCLGVLKNIYNDGMKWHDIACHHVKHVICEASV